MPDSQTRSMPEVPQTTFEWLLESENPAVAVRTRRTLLGLPNDADTAALWARRNEYPPVQTILNAQLPDGSWEVPARDYQKYRGSLWQIVFLGELWAAGDDPRVALAAEYVFSRQKPDGGWSANPKAHYEMPCLTANVGRALARMGWARDPRVIAALGSIVAGYEKLGFLGCSDMQPYTLNGYCHMLTPKVLLFMGEVPRELWPAGAIGLRDACVEALRDKHVHQSLPAEFAQFKDEVWPLPAAERSAGRARFVEKHAPLHYGDKPGWLRFGYPLSYNSDALEALTALASVGEQPIEAYDLAIDAVRSASDSDTRWPMRTSFNGKMIADVERKGAPSKWLTLRALQVLMWAARAQSLSPATQPTP